MAKPKLSDAQRKSLRKEIGARISKKKKPAVTAIDLGLFAEFMKKPMDGDVIRERLDLHPQSVLDFFNLLVAPGVLEFRRRRIPLPVSRP